MPGHPPSCAPYRWCPRCRGPRPARDKYLLYTEIFPLAKSYLGLVLDIQRDGIVEVQAFRGPESPGDRRGVHPRRRHLVRLAQSLRGGMKHLRVRFLVEHMAPLTHKENQDLHTQDNDSFQQCKMKGAIFSSQLSCEKLTDGGVVRKVLQQLFLLLLSARKS